MPANQTVNPHPRILPFLIDLQCFLKIKPIRNFLRRYHIGAAVFILHGDTLIYKMLYQLIVYLLNTPAGTVNPVDPGTVSKRVMVVHGKPHIGHHQTDRDDAQNDRHML